MHLFNWEGRQVWGEGSKAKTSAVTKGFKEREVQGLAEREKKWLLSRDEGPGWSAIINRRKNGLSNQENQRSGPGLARCQEQKSEKAAAITLKPNKRDGIVAGTRGRKKLSGGATGLQKKQSRTRGKKRGKRVFPLLVGKSREKVRGVIYYGTKTASTGQKEKWLPR